MALLKDSVVTGDLRVTNNLYSTTAQFQILKAPSTSGGTDYGLGTAGYVLKTGASGVYWAALIAADIPNLAASKITSGTFDTARIPTNISITGSAGSVAWGNVSNKPIDFIVNTSSLNSNGWKTLGGRSGGAKIAISYCGSNPASWNSGPYSASLVFGCSDTKGLLDCDYNTPTVTFGGGSVAGSTDNDPKWYFKISGTSGKIYTFPTDSKTLAATDGTGASGTWGINITGTSSNVTGTIAAANGGTGKTNLKDSANALINALDTDSSDLTANDYVITQYVGGGTTTTTYHRRPANKVINATLVKAALSTNSTHSNQFLRKDGTWQTPPYPVTSVAGKTGAVTLAKGDVGLGNVDNTADANKTVKDLTDFKVSKYTIPGSKGVRISYPTYSPVLISCQCSLGGGRLILIGGGYGAEGTVRNDFRELVSPFTNNFTWSLPNSASIYHSIEIMNNQSSGDATVWVWASNTCTFTEITTLTTEAMNASLLTTASTVPWSKISSKPTTISGYGITDAKIASGVITLGSNTISSQAAANGGTTVSLVTTGEKYIWNSKTSNTGTVTSITLKAGTGISLDTDNTAITTSGTRTISNTGVLSIGGLTGAVTLADLGLSNAMHFKGLTTTEMSDGLTTAAITIGGESYTPSAGDVVLYDDSEFVWTGSTWERLGRDSSWALNDHIHGNITNAGAITTTKTIANGDKIVIVNSSDNSKLIGSIITFDGSTTTKALTQKGTWETFNNYSHPSGDGNLHVPATSTTNNGKFLQAGSTAGSISWASLPTANSSTAGITTIGVDGGAAAYSHGNHVPTTETANNAKFLRNDNTWQLVTPANIGAVTKISSSTDNAIVRFDGTSGAIQNSGVIIDDNNNMTIGKNIILNDTNVPGQGEMLLAVLGFKTGYPLYTDPTFLSGTNSLGVYNNSGGDTVTHTRNTYSNFNIPSPGTGSNYVIKIQTTGTASPGCGGFYLAIPSRANAQFIQIFRALIPIGRNLYLASNSQGTDFKDEWLTSSAGTGKWEWYARRVLCGQEGSFSGGGYVSISGTAGTVDNPVIWYLASCNVYDVTKTQYDGLKTRYSDSTTAADLTTTANAIAYYTDTAGTFGTKASANGALYATSANGALQWGTLPVLQGGTGTTSIANIQAGKDGDGNTISSTYLKLSGGKLSGNLELNAVSGNSPALIFTRDGGLTDWRILVTAGKLSFQSTTDASSWAERASFADNNGNFTVTGSMTATSFSGSGASLTSLNASNIASGTVPFANLPTGTGTNQVAVGNHTHSGTYVPNTTGTNDVNTIVNTGIYNITSGSATNTPKGYGFGQLLVMSYRKHTGNTTTDWASQIYLHNGDGTESGSATGPGNVLYYRTSNASSWLTWRKAVHVADTYAKVGNSTTPVYIAESGEATACSSYAGGTAVTLNYSSKASSTASFYAPTTGGTADTQALVGNGATAAPKWVNISPSITIGAGSGSAAPTVNVTVLGQSGTAASITTASTSVYGVTKLNDGIASNSTELAATANSALIAASKTASSNNTLRLYLTGARTQASTGVDSYSYQYTYTENGLLSALKVGLNLEGTEKAHMEWNNTDQTIDFVFA